MIKNSLSNRKLAELVVISMDKRDFTLFEKHVSENAELDFSGSETVKGCRRIIVFLKSVLRKYPELKFTIKNIIVDEDGAAVVWSNMGRFKNGAPYNNRGITLVQMREGKIVLISDYFKDTSFLKKSE